MKFLTTKGISGEIINIIRTAKQFITIISPYVKIDDDYISRLHEADEKGVSIQLIFGKKDLNESEKKKLEGFYNLSIKYLDNLHAKCYMNENSAIMTSMNLHAYSEENNYEMGIQVDSTEEIYGAISDEAHHFWNHAVKYCLNNHSVSNFYCIRCKTETYDRLCDSCYQVWAQFENRYYPENFCHRCGKEEENISYDNPYCKVCSRLNNDPW